MKQMGAFEAKTHFSELLQAISRGESCIITRHGLKVALLSPFEEEKSSSPVKDAIRNMKKSRRGRILGKDLSIKQLREEGRR